MFIQVGSMTLCLPCAPHRQLHVAQNAWIHHCKAKQRPLYPARRPQTRCQAICSIPAENAEAEQSTSSAPARLIQRAQGKRQWHELPGTPKGFRCCLCYETDFATRSQLAEHLVSHTISRSYILHKPCNLYQSGKKGLQPGEGNTQ